jgi:hypothetical protein
MRRPLPCSAPTSSDARNRLDALGFRLPVESRMFSLDPDGGTWLKPDSVTQRYRRMCARFGWDMHLHQLRHYSATELIAAGVDVRTVAGRLGHGGGGTTTLKIYSAWRSEADQRAAGALVAGMPPLPGWPPVSVRGKRRGVRTRRTGGAECMVKVCELAAAGWAVLAVRDGLSPGVRAAVTNDERRLLDSLPGSAGASLAALGRFAPRRPGRTSSKQPCSAEIVMDGARDTTPMLGPATRMLNHGAWPGLVRSRWMAGRLQSGAWRACGAAPRAPNTHPVAPGSVLSCSGQQERDQQMRRQTSRLVLKPTWGPCSTFALSVWVRHADMTGNA